MPAPPKRAGTVMPRSPRSPRRRKSGRLNSSLRSAAAACGSTSRSVNSRTSCRSAACSGVGLKASVMARTCSRARGLQRRPGARRCGVASSMACKFWPGRATPWYSARMVLCRLACLAVLALVTEGLACPELPVAHDAPNPFELQLGATNVNAALGSGRLPAAFSRCGELTVLKSPGPSIYGQLDYLSSNAPDARTLPHFGALDSQGAFPGIAYRTAKGRGFTWLRDDDWTHQQRYSADTSDVLV